MPASQDETAVAHQRRPLIFQRVTRRARRPASARNARVGTTIGTTASALTAGARLLGVAGVTTTSGDSLLAGELTAGDEWRPAGLLRDEQRRAEPQGLVAEDPVEVRAGGHRHLHPFEGAAGVVRLPTRQDAPELQHSVDPRPPAGG